MAESSPSCSPGTGVASIIHELVGEDSLLIVAGPAQCGKTSGLMRFDSEFDGDLRIVNLDRACTQPAYFAEQLVRLLVRPLANRRPALGLSDLLSQLASTLHDEALFPRPLCIALDGIESLAGSPESTAVLEFLHGQLPRGSTLLLLGRFVPSATLEDLAKSAGTLHYVASPLPTHLARRPHGDLAKGLERSVAPNTDGLHQEFSTEDELTLALAGGWVYRAAHVAVSRNSPPDIMRVIESIGREAIIQGELSLLGQLFSDLSELVDSGQWSPYCQALYARICAAKRHNLQAIETALHVISIAERSPQDNFVQAFGHATLALIQAQMNTGQARECGELISRLLQPPFTNDPMVFTECLIMVADYELFLDGDSRTALFNLHHALDIADSLQNESLAALCLVKLANAYFSSSQILPAVDCLGRALAALAAAQQSARSVQVLNNLAVFQIAANQPVEARTSLTRALREARTTSLAAFEAYALASLAELELNLGRPEEARAYYSASLAICSRGLVEERLRALVLAGMSACALRLGDAREALVLASRAVAIAETAAGPVDQAFAKAEQARALAAAANRPDAERLLVDALATLEAAGAVGPAQQTRLRLAAFHLEDANHRTAKRLVRDALASPQARTHKGLLLGAFRENPALAHWARREPSLKRLMAPFSAEDCQPMAIVQFPAEAAAPAVGRSAMPATVLKSGRLDEAWTSSQARALFELFLEHQDGVVAGDARRLLHPDDPNHRGNSALHSALYQLERALHPGAIIREGDRYRLDPETARTCLLARAS